MTLFRRKRLVLILFCSISALSVAFAVLPPNKYQSRMRILVKNARAEVVITPEKTDAPSNSSEVSETQINSEIALLTSKDLLQQVVVKSGMDKSAADGNVPAVEAAVLELERDLEIARTRNADIIEISYLSSSPERAASVLQNLADLYLEKHVKLHRPAGTHEFFQNQTNQYSQQLQAVENTLAQFQQENKVISLDEQKQINLQKMAEARARYLESIGSVKDATQRIERLQQQLDKTPARVPTQSRLLPNQYSLERLSTMLVELRNRRTQLLTKFPPTDRLVREIDQQITDTRAALDEAKRSSSVEQASDINPLRQTLETEMAKVRLELAGQQARRDDLAQQLQQYEATLSQLEQATKQHVDLKRQVSQAEGNYQLYAKKQEEARIADELDEKKITNVSLAESPVVQRAPAKPNRRLTLGLGVFLAVFVSLTAVFVAELTRDTVHTPRELEQLIDIPVIASFRHDLKLKA